LKDQELILRFFALYFFLDEYERPMNEFLNKYMGANRNLKLHSPQNTHENRCRPLPANGEIGEMPKKERLINYPIKHPAQPAKQDFLCFKYMALLWN